MNKIIFATGNEGKAREVRKIFGDDFEIVTLRDLNDRTEIVEDGDTFEANAKIKAKAIYDKYKLPVISDDSGLAVEQLDGEPGVHSARYAGRKAGDLDNNQKLLKELKIHPQPHKAKFVCCAVYYEGDNFTAALGEVPGEIIKGPRGSNGFGYDPLFIPEGYDKTMAELELEEKNKISHRSRAFNKLRELIKR